MIPALYFRQEAFSSAGEKLMGRNVAGESFLRALLQHCGDGPLTVQVDDKADAAAFLAEAARWGSAVTPQFVSSAYPATLREAGGVFYSDPRIAECAWARAPFGGAEWSLCGINHTTSSVAAMDAVVAMLRAPVEPWDALICTSTAVKDNIVRLIEGEKTHLRDRLGARSFPLPMLPVIPLGVHCRDFEPPAGARERHRAALGIGADECVILFVGRLSFHAKTHPAAMYSALERVSGTAKVMLVEFGQFPNEAIEKSFGDAAAMLCPSVRRIVLNGRVAENRDAAWAVGDVFCSLADNLQEAFGLTPVEAMAAGMPVVVSDWNGYRDSVRHGVDGFRIPTLMPPAGQGSDLALRFQFGLDNYDHYIGFASALTAVDVDAAADALTQLAGSPELRRTMGESGRRRARELYDWTRVFPQYQALWDELAAIRTAAPAVPPRSPPTRRDPFDLFAGYPTAALDPQRVVALAVADPRARLHALRENPMFTFADAILPDVAEFETMLDTAGAGACSAGELLAGIAPERRPVALRGVAWLLKIGLLRLLPAPPNGAAS